MLLFIVASVSVTGIFYAGSRGSARGETAQRQASAEELELARQAAQGGFEDGLSRLVADIAARPTATDRGMGDGYGRYDLRVADTAHGSVRITSRGAYQTGGYVVEAELLELMRLGAPLIVHAEKVKGTIEKKAVLDGNDHRVPGAAPRPVAGPAGANPAIGVTLPGVRDELIGKLLSDPASLRGGSALVPPPAEIQALVERLVGDPITQTMETFELKGGSIGSPLAPVVVHATKEAKIEKGAVGYGILIVDGDFSIKESQWEGLIVVRADAGAKRKVLVDKKSKISGSLVLLGVEHAGESDGGAGFPGGHMDLDLFEGSGAPLPRVYHEHEWDDTYDLTSLDFLGGPDIGPAFSGFLSRYGERPLRVEFFNAFNSSGTYTIGSYTGRTEAGFGAVLTPATMVPFVVSFDALCALRGTNPGNVKDDGVNRDRSFTVRFYDGTRLVYAVSAYEHAKTLRDGDPACGAGTGAGAGTGTGVGDVYGEFDLNIKDDASIEYSEEALGRLGRTVSSIRDTARRYPLLVRSVPVER